MGKYVNSTSKENLGSSASEKINGIIADGGEVIPEPAEFMDNLVCVVDNGFFGAAAYADTEHEMKVFKTPSDTRPKVWLRWDKVAQFAM